MKDSSLTDFSVDLGYRTFLLLLKGLSFSALGSMMSWKRYDTEIKKAAMFKYFSLLAE